MVVLPSNISTGVFVQVAGDNNDINEDTLDGKRTTHATTLVLFQRGQFGPAPKPKVYADLPRGNGPLDRWVRANLSDSTVHMESVQLLLVSPEGLITSCSNLTNACIRKPA